MSKELHNLQTGALIPIWCSTRTWYQRKGGGGVGGEGCYECHIITSVRLGPDMMGSLLWIDQSWFHWWDLRHGWSGGTNPKRERLIKKALRYVNFFSFKLKRPFSYYIPNLCKITINPLNRKSPLNNYNY